jgi:hypothetical protein
MKRLSDNILKELCKEIDRKTEYLATFDEIIDIESGGLIVVAEVEGWRTFKDPDMSVGYYGGLKDEEIAITILSVYELESGNEVELEQKEY